MNDKNQNEVDDAEVLDGEIIEPVGTGMIATIHRVEIDQQIATAKNYPRSLSEVMQTLVSLCTVDEDTAESCVYALPRGGKTIRGPSARFADALISIYGNARSDAFVVQVDKEDKFVEAVGTFQDVERNVIRRRRVRRPISDRHGRIYNSDMINMTGNAACVIAERNAILNGIPKAIWTTAYERAFALVAGTIQTLESKRDRAFGAFNVMGIQPDQVLEKLGRRDLSAVVLDDIVTLRGMLTALREGSETPETIFGRGAGHQHETVKNPLKDEAVDQDGVVQEEKKADPISTGIRGASQKTAEADLVVEDGQVVKDRQSDVQAETAGKPQDAPAEKEGTKAASQAETAQAASPGPAKGQPYTDAGTYIDHMLDLFDSSSSAAAINDEWSRTRADRSQMLTTDAIADLTKRKSVAVERIKAKKGGA